MGVNTRIKQDNTYLNYLTRVINDGGSYELVPLYQYKEQYDKLQLFNPVLFLFPSAQKNNNLYTVTPNNLSGFTMSRNSVGVFFNKTRNLQIAQNNQPLIEWDPSNLEFGGVKIEPALTNSLPNNNTSLLTQSSVISNTLLLNEFGDGVNGFNLIQVSGTFLSQSYQIGPTLNIQSGSVVTYNTIIKNPSGNLYGFNATSLVNILIYNFNTLTTNNINNDNRILSSYINQIGDNTYRIGFSASATTSIQFFQARQGLIRFTSNNPPTADGSFTIGLPTIIVTNNGGYNSKTLIPTSGVTVTKQEDILLSPLLNYNTTQWSVFFDIEYLYDFVSQTGDVSADPLIWYFRRLNNSAVNFWNQNAQQNLGSFTFSPANSVKRFRGIISFNGSTISTFVNGTKIGNQITPTNPTPFQNFLNTNTYRIRSSKVNLINTLDSGHLIRFVAAYDYQLNDEQSINLTRF